MSGAVIVDGQHQQVARPAQQDAYPGRAGVLFHVAQSLAEDGHNLTADIGRHCSSGLQLATDMEPSKDAPARRDTPHFVSECFFPQVIEDASGVGNSTTCELGKFGQLLVERLPVGGPRSRRQGIGHHGDTKQGLADGVVHLPGNAGPLGGDRCADMVVITEGGRGLAVRDAGSPLGCRPSLPYLTRDVLARRPSHAAVPHGAVPTWPRCLAAVRPQLRPVRTANKK